MSQGTQKVWVIKPPKNDKAVTPITPPETRAQSVVNDRRHAPVRQTAGANKAWRKVPRAYLLGPVATALRPEGQRSVVWTSVGLGALGAGLTMLAFWSVIARWLESIPNGAVLWLVMVPLITISLATSWVRAVAVASCTRPASISFPFSWIRRPWAVGLLGTLVPGLGLMITGHPKRAAWTFWIVGPIAAAAIILFNWRWLWERNQSSVPSGMSATALEITLLAAVGVAVVMLLIWIVQALDGVRRVSSSRSRALTDATGIALLVSLVLFFTTFRPASFAQNLDVAAISLQQNGFSLIPLGLCEAATRLDPAKPAYLARAAELNEALGMKKAALAKKEIIEQRAREYIELVGRDVRGDASGSAFAGKPAPVTTPYLHGALDVEDYVTSNDLHSWSRLGFRPR